MKWIRISDELPPEGELVLTYRPHSVDLKMEVDYVVRYENDEWCWACTCDDYTHLITHWMPLPEEPND